MMATMMILGGMLMMVAPLLDAGAGVSRDGMRGISDALHEAFPLSRRVPEDMNELADKAR